MPEQDDWDRLNAEFQERRQALLNQLKELDQWYGEQVILLVEPQNSPL